MRYTYVEAEKTKYAAERISDDYCYFLYYSWNCYGGGYITLVIADWEKKDTQ